MELFLLRGTSFVESVADGFVQNCSFLIIPVQTKTNHNNLPLTRSQALPP